MVACERCRSELPADAVFCARCGRRAAASWATVKEEPEDVGEPAHSREELSGNALSTMAVFFGVVALLNLWIGIVALVLALGALRRHEPSSRFAVGVATVGSVLGVVVRILLFDRVHP